MTRIEKKFQELKQKKEKALISFITAGDPNFESTIQYIQAIEE